MGVRLVRYLAQCGVASRRRAGEIVQRGLVSVNGEVARDMSLQIEPGDRVSVRGRAVRPPDKTVVLMLNKPAGQVCSRRDPHNPETVLNSLPRRWRGRLKPVGRLDKETTGLLLLTDDGALAYRLTHPRYGVKKTYRAVVEGEISDEAVNRLASGVRLDDGETASAEVRVLKRATDRSRIEITIREGRKRQVRRMCEAVGRRVLILERTGFGPLRLGELRHGESRLLTASEAFRLRRSVGLDTRE